MTALPALQQPTTPEPRGPRALRRARPGTVRGRPGGEGCGLPAGEGPRQLPAVEAPAAELERAVWKLPPALREAAAPQLQPPRPRPGCGARRET